jgi:hypothetical protein
MEEVLAQKTCVKCGGSEWYKRSAKSKGDQCAVCARAHAKLAPVRERLRAGRAAWRLAHPERHQQYSEEYRQTHRLENRQYQEAFRLLNLYGITPEERQAMFEAQGGVCAICGQPETSVDPRLGTVRALSVDHCHRTLLVRALLCARCNWVLGRVNDSPQLLAKLIAYLERYAPKRAPLAMALL